MKQKCLYAVWVKVDDAIGGDRIKQTTPGLYTTTERGKALVDHIRKLPLPVGHTEWRME